jgi:Ca2+/H+ antiporter, TMEM165/GDT1 family
MIKISQLSLSSNLFVTNSVTSETPSSEVISPMAEIEPSIDRQKSGALATFLSTFITIFLAEMGDKTQLATLLLSAQSQSPWIVFVGAGSALIATSLVGVLLGRYLAKFLSPRTLDIAAGMLLTIVSILLLGDVMQL